MEWKFLIASSLFQTLSAWEVLKGQRVYRFGWWFSRPLGASLGGAVGKVGSRKHEHRTWLGQPMLTGSETEMGCFPCFQAKQPRRRMIHPASQVTAMAGHPQWHQPRVGNQKTTGRVPDVHWLALVWNPRWSGWLEGEQQNVWGVSFSFYFLWSSEGLVECVWYSWQNSEMILLSTGVTNAFAY